MAPALVDTIVRRDVDTIVSSHFPTIFDAAGAYHDEQAERRSAAVKQMQASRGQPRNINVERLIPEHIRIAYAAFWQKQARRQEMFEAMRQREQASLAARTRRLARSIGRTLHCVVVVALAALGNGVWVALTWPFRPTRFKIGDVVYLRGGSPAMTVTAVWGNTVEVVWFADKQPQSSQFKTACVQL